VGNDLWDAGEYEHDEPGHPPGGLDAQKKPWGQRMRGKECDRLRESVPSS